MPRIERERASINMWVVGGLVSLLSGLILTNQYWINQSVVDMKQDISVLRFAVFKTVQMHSSLMPPGGKSPLLAVPLLLPLPVSEENNEKADELLKMPR